MLFWTLENRCLKNLGWNLIYVNLEPKFFDLRKLTLNVKLLIYETQGTRGVEVRASSIYMPEHHAGAFLPLGRWEPKRTIENSSLPTSTFTVYRKYNLWPSRNIPASFFVGKLIKELNTWYIFPLEKGEAISGPRFPYLQDTPGRYLCMSNDVLCIILWELPGTRLMLDHCFFLTLIWRVYRAIYIIYIYDILYIIYNLYIYIVSDIFTYLDVHIYLNMQLSWSCKGGKGLPGNERATFSEVRKMIFLFQISDATSQLWF